MRWLAMCALAAGCGRLGFETEMSTDARPSPIDPLAITSRQLGPVRYSTTSSTFVDIPDAVLMVPPSVGTRWLLLVSASLASTSLDFQGPEARYLVDGVERGIGGTESAGPDTAGPWQHLYVFDGAAGSTTIAFQLRDALSATTTIDQLRAVVVPFAPADLIYASDDGPITVTSTIEASIASLTLEPSVAGDYLVLLGSNTTEAPMASNIFSRWYDQDGLSWTPEFQIPRGAMQSNLFVRRATLTGAATVALRGYTQDVATAAYIRAAALRVAAVPSLVEMTNETMTNTASATPIVAVEVTPAPSSEPQHLVLSTLRIDDNCDNSVLSIRQTELVIDADVRAIRHETGNCAYENTAGFVELRPSRPTLVQARYSSGNGEIVEFKDGSVVALGVP